MFVDSLFQSNGLRCFGFRRRKLQRGSGNLSAGITTTLVEEVEVEEVETMGAVAVGGVDRISTDMHLRPQVMVLERVVL